MSVQETANSEDITGLQQTPFIGQVFKTVPRHGPLMASGFPKRAGPRDCPGSSPVVCFLCVLGNSFSKAVRLFMIWVQGCSASEISSVGHRNQIKIRHKCPMSPGVNASQSRK